MDSVVLSAQILDVVNDIVDEITGYSRDRKINFTVNLFEEGEFLKVKLIYKDTEKTVFEGTFHQVDVIEAIKMEDEKEREREKNE